MRPPLKEVFRPRFFKVILEDSEWEIFTLAGGDPAENTFYFFDGDSPSRHDYEEIEKKIEAGEFEELDESDLPDVYTDQAHGLIKLCNSISGWFDYPWLHSFIENGSYRPRFDEIENVEVTCEDGLVELWINGERDDYYEIKE